MAPRAGVEQPVGGALLDDAATFEDEHAVGPAHGRQAVTDDKNRAPSREAFH